jgi:hypothetical protein
MAILANERVLTLDYWKIAHDLKVGDIIFNSKGQPKKITLVQEYRAENCYRIYLNDHLTVAGDEYLQFLVESSRYRDQLGKYKGRYRFTKQLLPISAKELDETPLINQYDSKIHSIPTTNPIQLPHQTLPVPPFIFGYWFFNRRWNKRMAPPYGFTEIVHEEFKNHGYQITERNQVYPGRRSFFTTPTIESHLVPHLPNNIPNNYLLASVEQRTELLRGILHARSRQYDKKTEWFRITAKNKILMNQIQFLLESLGHVTRCLYDVARKHYTVYFKSKLKLMENQSITKPLVHHGRRYIKSVEKIPSQLCVHIETDGEDNTLLVGEGFISCL